MARRESEATAVSSPCDRLIARRRRGRVIAWCLFLLAVAAIVLWRVLFG
jgi:hypothetical protein